MKKGLAIFFFVALALTTVVRLLQPGTPTLEITVLLADDGPDVTDQVRLYVGYVPSGTAAAPSLGNIHVIRPTPGSETTYQVPPNRDIGVFALSRGVPAFRSIVSVGTGEYLEHDFVLNAGWVDVTTSQSSRGEQHIWFVDPNGQIDTNDRFPSGTRFLAPAGSQTFQVGLHTHAKRQTFMVVAGQTQPLHIDNRLGALRVELETALAFGPLSPSPILVTDAGSVALRQVDGTFETGRWSYGTYSAQLSLRKRFVIPIRDTRTAPVPIVIDRAENVATLQLPLMGAEAVLQGWPTTLPEYASAMIVSLSDPGHAFATTRIAENRAPLMFIRPDQTHDYAIAIVGQLDVLALHPIAPHFADTQARVVIQPGGDRALCRTVVLDFNCDALSP